MGLRLNPFGRPEDQQVTLVASHPATHKTQFMRSLPWFAAKGGLVGTIPQLKARRAFAQFMINRARGKTGTVTLPDGRRISKGAYLAMTQYPKTGTGAFGGSPEERRRKQYEAADRNVRKLKEEIEKRKGVARAAGAAAKRAAARPGAAIGPTGKPRE